MTSEGKLEQEFYIVLSYDENRQVVVREALLVQQQLNHRCHSGPIARQQLGPKELTGTAANHNTSTCRLPGLMQVRLGGRDRSETNRETTGKNVLACSV